MQLASFLIIFLCCTLCSCDSNPSIVIIGAGASGIAAATRLIKNGFTEIKILEAEDRIGGRIHSVKFGDAFVDMGVDWYQELNDDVNVFKLAKNYGIFKEADVNSSLVFYSKSDIDDDIFDDIVNIVDELFTSKDAYNSSFRNLSAKDYFMQIYSPILDKYKSDPKKYQQAKEGIGYAKACIEGYDGAFDWNDDSFFTNFAAQPDDSRGYYCNGLGYHTILNILMEKYPEPKNGLPIDDKIIVSKEVKTIHWNNDNKKAKVECTDGSNFEADHVIFTPSIGVLKNHHETLFNPKLDADKVEAVSKLGYGAIAKIFLHFENPWWQPEDPEKYIMWSDEDKQKLLSEFPEAPKKDNNSWLSYFYLMFPAPNDPKVLNCWFEGPIVPEVETMKQEDIIKGVMYAIREVFGNDYNITDPDSMIHSKWWTNPHFHGTLSYETVEGNNLGKDLHAILAKPLENDGKIVVQFAGEATHGPKFSTVQGAIESGFREADHILKLHNKNIIE